MNNYHLNVDIPEAEVGDHRIVHEHYPAGKVFELTNLRSRIFTGDQAAPVRFEHSTRWHRLEYSGGVWMTDYPMEQYQHDQLLQDFSGRVLVGGLGLGYAANVLASMDAVTEVLVVEISSEVIQLVQPYLKDPAGKVKVVEADILKFLAVQNEGEVFDFGFFDTWQSDGETTFHDVVCPILTSALDCGWINKDENIRCWNEGVMRGQLANSIIGRVMMAMMSPDKDKVWDRFLTPCNDRADRFFAWMRPFLKWFKEFGEPHMNNLMELAFFYASRYARVGWQADWEKKIEGLEK